MGTTYSLVSASALGFDLVRSPSGDRVAEVLLTALDCGPDDLAALAAVHPGPARTARWQNVRTLSRVPTVRATLDLAGPALDLAAAGEPAAGRDVLTHLARAPLGDLDGLDRLVRHDVLEATWTVVDGVGLQDVTAAAAADVLVDAAAAAYASDRLDDALRRDLAVPFVTARAQLTQREHAGPAVLQRLLADVATWDASTRTRWRDAVDVLRPGAVAWAPSMHEACWAVHLTGRVRTGAAAQLRAVQAFARAGLTAHDAAHGSWNALSGCVQALLVEDLLPAEHRQTLLAPWLLARGGAPA